MPGFFEALENIKKPKEKVHTVTIQGKSVVVTLEKKLEVMAKGEDAYIWKTETEFVLKPPPKVLPQYKTLKKTEEKGYEFFDNDPFYPTGVVEGGFRWVRE